jgi:molecular chaperone DnaJ
MYKRDYYEVLGLERGAEGPAIKKAYRQIALDSHPDRNPGDHAAEERFKEASEAYEVLSDTQKRQVYDAYGHQGLNSQGFQGYSDVGVEDVFSSFGDIFGDLFGMGGRSGGRRARSGQNLQTRVELTLDEVATGLEREVEIERSRACAPCGGSGAEPGSTRETCAGCGGAGHITSRQGFFVMQTTCPQCHGEGSAIQTKCDECSGQGVVRERKALKVKIPAGVEDGMQLVLRGEGDAGPQGGPAGDLYVAVHVAAHGTFERHGDDILARIELAFPKVALGTRLTVPTLYGNEQLKVPAGTDSGAIFRLRSKGMPNVHSRQKGDHVIEIRVVTPKRLSKRQRKLLEEFMDESAKV